MSEDHKVLLFDTGEVAFEGSSLLLEPKTLAEIQIYEHDNFGGSSLRVNIGYTFPQDHFWNDTISSIIITSGRWRICVANDGRIDEGYVDKGVGRYANATEIGLPNDSISSFYPLSDGP